MRYYFLQLEFQGSGQKEESKTIPHPSILENYIFIDFLLIFFNLTTSLSISFATSQQAVLSHMYSKPDAMLLLATTVKSGNIVLSINIVTS
jgi:hypothetical protein